MPQQSDPPAPPTDDESACDRGSHDPGDDGTCPCGMVRRIPPAWKRLMAANTVAEAEEA